MSPPTPPTDPVIVSDFPNVKRSAEPNRGAGGGGHALTGTRRDATAALILGLLAAALLAQNADAQTKPDRWSANYLMPACRNWITFAGDRQGIDEALCAGIISGLAYTVKFLPPDSSSCTPQGVTTGEMVRVVVAYIERRPERMHEDFRRLAVEAWHEAWPCMWHQPQEARPGLQGRGGERPQALDRRRAMTDQRQGGLTGGRSLIPPRAASSSRRSAQAATSCDLWVLASWCCSG